jgi:WD40 repeat protein
MNSTMIASASPDSTIYLWNVEDASFSSSPLAVIREHLTAVVALAASLTLPGILASAGDDREVLWHNVVAATAEGHQAVVKRFVDPLDGQSILALAFSYDGEWFAMAGNRSAILWHIPSNSLLRTIEPAVSTSILSSDVAIGETAAVSSVSFAFDSAWMALRFPTTVQVWPLSQIAPNDGQSPNSDQGEAPALGEWVTFTSEDLVSASLRWTVYAGPYGNRPVYSGQLNEDRDELELRFAPCNITESNHSCAEDLPHIRVDIEVPFEFTAVQGTFLEYSMGDNGADDCRGATNHTSWEAEGSATKYWTLVAEGRRAEGEDCPSVGGGDAYRVDDVYTLESCKAECLTNGFCNFINFRQNPPNCDLRRCLDPAHPALTVSADDECWAFVRREELEERLLPIHDGYVMFGAPSYYGSGGIVYGGCQAGPDIPTTGVTITIPLTSVPQTKFLRWQVAQSRNTEQVGIKDVALRLWRPVEGRHSIAVSSSSSLLAFSPGRRELTVAVGEGVDLAVWDLRGIDFPATKQEERLLKTFFSFELEAVGLLDLDRVRIVESLAVPICGDTFSSVTSAKVQGLGDGRRTSGTANYSFWNMTLITKPGEYRICFCGGRRTACCALDADFAQQIMTFVVAGVESDHYDVCESKTPAQFGIIDCIVQNVRGTGIKDADKIMIQDAGGCGLATGPIPGLPNSGVMTARQPRVDGESLTYEAEGSWYRFEYRSDIYDEAYSSYRYIADSITSAPGFTARMCWCPLAGNCGTDPAEYRIFAGLLSVVRIERTSQNNCMVGKECIVVLEIFPYNTPVITGDLIVVKTSTGSQPPRRIASLDAPSVCKGDVVSGLGPQGDGFSARMKVAVDTRPEAQVSDEAGIFNMSIPAEGSDGDYRLCWCQASIRPCRDPEEFLVDIGRLTVTVSQYVWPTCTTKEPDFTGWRTWTTFDDCCCNYYEAGAVGCLDSKTDTFSRCSELPRR